MHHNAPGARTAWPGAGGSALLGLDYSPAVPLHLLRELERAARGLGLPLATVERIGQSERLCRAFVAAVRRGDRGRAGFLADLVAEVLVQAPPRALAPTAR